MADLLDIEVCRPEVASTAGLLTVEEMKHNTPMGEFFILILMLLIYLTTTINNLDWTFIRMDFCFSIIKLDSCFSRSSQQMDRCLNILVNVIEDVWDGNNCG